MKQGSLKFAVAVLAGALAVPAAAQESAPAAASAPAMPSIPAAADRPYLGGTILLDIDASDVLRGTFRVTETIPLAPGAGRMTLLLPEWLPGHHGPRGTIAELVDLRLSVDGEPVAWTRDPLDVAAFHVDLPAGAKSLIATFIHTSPLRSSEGRVTVTPEMLNLQWEKMSLYPAGYYVSRIRIRPSVTFPRNWTAATALTGPSYSGVKVSWAETDYETLVDSPVFAGANFRKWDLGNSAELDAVADSPDLLHLAPDNLAAISALVEEALQTFGDPPFERYEFLLALSDRLGSIGLEHLSSSENQMEARNFVAWDEFDWDRNVLAHELSHAWNGKFRRPARLWTPDYRTPMQDDLLWVYEGQTQFWGWVLAARSGLQGKDIVLGTIAQAAGYLAEQPGRGWRSVSDTTLDPVIAARKPKPYDSLARGEDYYREGALIWLEADQIIREGTGGRKGLDDFARAFFAHPKGAGRVSLYERADIVAALSRIYAYDWDGFFRQRIDTAGQPAPLAGITKAGYRLVWKDKPNPYAEARMRDSHNLNLYHSIGLTVLADGSVDDVRWDSPAFAAGVVPGTSIVAVDSTAFTPVGLQLAITRAAGDKKPVELLIRRGDRFSIVPVPYYDGLRWPWLERANAKGPAPLDLLLSPRRRNAPK